MFKGELSCKPKDDDKCLQDRWNRPLGRNWECKDLTVGGEYPNHCKDYPKDARRCCPVSCENKKPFNKFACESAPGKGKCRYPNRAQCGKIHNY